MPIDDTQLESEFIINQTDIEREEFDTAQRDNLLAEIDNLKNETDLNLEEIRTNFSDLTESIEEDTTDLRRGISQPTWSTAPLVILAAGSVIKPEATIMNIAATVGGGAVTLTSNPSIEDGINGQVLILRGSHSTDTITLTDGNGMQMNGSITLGLNDIITFYYDAVVTNDWIEISRSDNLSLTLSGVYSPIVSSETNLDATTTATEAQYMRVGNTVTVSGRFTANPTTTTTATNFELSLPIASNIGAAEDLAGVAFCGAIAGQGAAINGVVANDTAQVEWLAGDITAQTWSYTFSYQVI